MTTSDCIFCNPHREVIAQSKHCLAYLDKFPVTKGHALVVPRRHVVTIWEMTDEEYTDAFFLARNVKEILNEQFHPDGFNIGVNCGEFAGQSVWHAHIHVMPRYKGDIENPRGGVRHIIPGRGNY